jgi:uncharacterized protein YciI
MNEDSGQDRAFFLYKLIPPRPTFDADMSDGEAAVMGQHVDYWKKLTERGTAVVFGPVGDPAGVWGLAVIEVEDEGEARDLGLNDPAVTSGVATFETHAMPATIVR